jgi:hypothetical protein
MVPGTDQDGGVPWHRGRALTGHPRKTRAEFLQSPQAARWFRKPEVPLPSFPDRGLVDGGYLRRELQYPILEGHV